MITSATAASLQGLYVPHLTPLLSDGQIDFGTLQRYVDWLAGYEIAGLYPNGSMGEFIYFSSAERSEITRAVLEAAQGRLHLMAGAAEANIEQTVATAKQYADWGVDTVAVVPPYYFRVGEQAVYEFYAAIARDIPNRLTLYNIPAFASPIGVDCLKRLADIPQIIGIKDSSGDVPHMMRSIAAVSAHREDFAFLTGWDAALAPMLLVGCDGGVNAMTGIVPELTTRIYSAARSGHWSEAVAWQQRLLPIFDAIFAGGEFPEGFRQAAAVRGWDFGRSRMPASAEARDKAKACRQKLEKLIGEVLDDLRV